ncbi:MAG: biotin/lipoyl-binding protein, partial [Bacteroidales bacterium]|nr:biotin/lipoyl-binding protein [Bacteroidales bacterium]
MDRAIEQKKGLKKKHIGYIALGVFLIVIIYAAFFTDHTSTLRVYKDRLVIEEVKYGTFDDYTTINGQVEPIATVYMDVEEGGRVEERLIEEGSTVKKGDIIIRLSNPDLRMRILDSEAQLAEKSNFLRNTRVAMEQEKLQIRRQILTLTYEISRLKRDYERNKVLFEEELVSEEVYLTSKENFEFSTKSYELSMKRQESDSIFRNIQVQNMEDGLANMKRNLEMVRLRQENLNVKAPVDGQLGSLEAEIGESIQRGQRIGQVNVLTSHR